MSDQYVVFNLNNISFGIKINHVTEIINIHEVFKVPNTPLCIEGLINLRDKVYTILNLREMFNLPKKNLNNEECGNENSKILLVNINSKFVGLIVDSVNEIKIIESEKIMSPSEFESQFDSSFLEGIAKINDSQLLLLLDLDMLLNKVIDKQVHCTV
ncbi:chemotaxis protein CheW [Herbivorax sp. ANBcel31]|uniref:chemotaxis protein CheW n=1 Tax=Herbivorax sp. ANBcel31 TaxID=3069754 RepID=UPI0027B2020B|nr:chemotaxis protein CheW [Herbivorax sp. ANBcel31]MDQ2086286.1 chemotaxis protein CheW [Herbivorax sp. ANBcel31]